MEPPSTNTAINHNPSSPPDSSDSGNVDDDQLLVPEYVPPFPFDHDAKDGSDLRIHATFGSALPKLAFPVPSGDREVTKHTYVPPPTPGNTAKEFSLNDVLVREFLVFSSIFQRVGYSSSTFLNFSTIYVVYGENIQ
jgi:hypothetical protein